MGRNGHPGLFADEGGAKVAARIDRRVDALPGLAGLGLMQRAIDTYATAAAVSTGGAPGPRD